MKYLNFVYLTLLLAAVGCQVSGHYEQGVPFRAEHRQPEEVQRATETPRGFWAGTRRFFRLFLPETEQNMPPSPPPPASPPPASQLALFDPNAAFYASNTGTSATRPSRMMLDFGFMEEPLVEPEPEPMPEQTSNSNLLRARSGDSEAFRRLLEEFEKTPETEWQVDREELATRLTNFRAAVRAEKNPNFETQYLFHLRESVLPESRRRTAKRSVPIRKPIEEDVDEQAGYQAEEDIPEPISVRKSIASRSRNKAPLPPGERLADEAAKKTAPPRNDASVVQASYRTTEASNPVTTADHVEPVRNEAPPAAPVDNWEANTRLAVEQLRRKIEQTSGGRTLASEARLRLLELALGNRSEAVRPLTAVDASLNDFWGSQMLGLSTLLDEAAMPELQPRIVAAAFRFDEATSSLNRLCPMKLKNVQFVKDWATFGVFLPRNEDCRAGENVGLYMELDNPTIRRSAQGYNVRMSISYEIRDNAANIVHHVEKDEMGNKIVVEEMTPSQKRDYCIHLLIRLPKTLAHGQYQLRVNVTDMNSDAMQYAEEQIPLKILPATNVPEEQRRSSIDR